LGRWVEGLSAYNAGVTQKYMVNQGKREDFRGGVVFTM